MSVDRDSEPPSSPVPTRRWDDGADQTYPPHNSHDRESKSERALRIAISARRAIGSTPDPLRKEPGTGLWKSIGELHEQNTGIQGSVNLVLSKLAAKDELAAKHNGWAGKLAWKLIDTVVPIVILAIIAYLAGFRRG